MPETWVCGIRKLNTSKINKFRYLLLIKSRTAVGISPFLGVRYLEFDDWNLCFGDPVIGGGIMKYGAKQVAPPGVPGKRADLLYVVIFCRLVLRDDYLVSRLA